MIKIYSIKHFKIIFKRKLEGIYSTPSNNIALLSLKIKLKNLDEKSLETEVIVTSYTKSIWENSRLYMSQQAHQGKPSSDAIAILVYVYHVSSA